MASRRRFPVSFVRDGGYVDKLVQHRRSALPRWLLAAICAASVAVSVVAAWRWTWHRGQLDFAVYMMGAHNLMNAHLYTQGLSYAPYLPYTYPPFSAVLFLPLSVLATQAAALLWALLNLAALFIILALTINGVRPELDRASKLAWSMGLLAPALLIEPVSLTFSYGQVNLVLAAFVLADLTGHVRFGDSTLPRGVLVGVCAAVKLVPLIFVAYLFITRQARAAWTSIATFLGCSLVAAAFEPSNSWAFWTKYVVDAQRVGGVTFISNQSLRGALDRLTHHYIGAGAITALAGLVGLAGLALAYVAWRRSSPFLGLLVCSVTGLLASPITWAHHMVWVVPVIIWLIWGRDRPAGGSLYALATVALFWWAPIWRVPSAGLVALHEHGWQLVEGNAFFFAAAAFMVLIAAMLFVRARRAAPGATRAAHRPSARAPRPSRPRGR
jgi:alpha-1,2-mannosyltransferase